VDKASQNHILEGRIRMLNELYEAFGEKQIIKELENQSANGIYLRIPLDREINTNEDLLIVNNKEDINAKNEKLFDWFKYRKRCCSYINSNKSLIIGGKYKYPRIIITNQVNSVRFNSDTLMKKSEGYKISFEESFNEMVNEFCIGCNEPEKFEYYKKGISIITKKFKELESNKNVVINMFLDVSEDEYITKRKEYLNNKLIDGSIKDGQGIFSLFATSNSEKPHLFMRSNIYNNNSAYKTTIENAEKLLDLQSYLMRKQEGNVKCKNGTIKYNSKDGNILEYSYYPTQAYDIFEKKALYIGDYKVDTNFKFKVRIEKLLEKNLNNDIKMFKVLYEKYYSNIDNLSVKHFKNNYKKILDNLYRIAYRDFESEYKLKNIIDFNLYTSDYFFNTNIVREFQEMKEKMINKIKQLKETKIYTIESDEEFWYLTGTIIAYITNLSKSNNSTLRLRINYCNINNKNQILNKLTMDFKRYCYDLDVNSRCTKIFSSILNYGDNVNKINKLKFQQGLFETDSIMYTKLEENKLNEKEGEM
jgi:hypothetical protein